MAKRDKRLTLAPLGEYYIDLLMIDAWVNGRSQGVQGTSLLCAKLQEREGRLKERMEYLAKKRGITTEELWQQVLKGEATNTSEEEDDGGEL